MGLLAIHRHWPCNKGPLIFWTPGDIPFAGSPSGAWASSTLTPVQGSLGATQLMQRGCCHRKCHGSRVPCCCAQQAVVSGVCCGWSLCLTMSGGRRSGPPEALLKLALLRWGRARWHSWCPLFEKWWWRGVAGAYKKAAALSKEISLQMLSFVNPPEFCSVLSLFPVGLSFNWFLCSDIYHLRVNDTAPHLTFCYMFVFSKTELL